MPTSLYESFDDLHIKRQHAQTVLEGLNHNDRGSVTARKSIALDRYIGNKDGQFQWRGRQFTQSADGITLERTADGAAVLRANLQKEDKTWREDRINLDDHFGNADEGFAVE